MLPACNDSVVTSRTRSHHLQMIDSCNRAERHRVVTVLTHIGRRNVVGRLALGRCSVVTRRAIAVDSGMVEKRRSPGRGPMTVVALVVSRQVIRRFTGSPPIVMATLACAVSLEMVDSRDWHPGCGAMTGVAAFRGRDMRRRLDRGPHQAGRSMTIPALSRGTCESAIDMTGLAVDIFMGTVETISGRVMIKR